MSSWTTNICCIEDTLKDGLHPGDFVMEAWKTEKFMSV